MKSFLQKIVEEQGTHPQTPALSTDDQGPVHSPTVRLAVYDSLTSAPRVIDLSGNDYEELINLLATKTYQFSHEKGGSFPFTVIREVVENLIHAYFNDAVITILDNGNTIRISDHGPGIQNKEKAFLPGFSTATSALKKVIKGVGSGLPIAKETLFCTGGQIVIEDNMGQGTVITLSMPNDAQPETQEHTSEEQGKAPTLLARLDLNERQKRALFLVTELGEAGPSKIGAELDVSLSTAYRDLMYLEKLNLIQSDEHGKRSLTTEGVQHLDEILYS